jgi:hypothetical protein
MSTAREVRSMASGGTQLALLEADEAPWRLDPHTREVGRRGVAEARQALRCARGGSGRPVSSQAA